MKEVPVPLPIYMAKEGKWFVASCPVLDIATQGLTEEEVKENMQDLIHDFLNDPDTQKPDIDTIMSVSLTNVPVKISEGVLYRKTTSSSAK